MASKKASSKTVVSKAERGPHRSTRAQDPSPGGRADDSKPDRLPSGPRSGASAQRGGPETKRSEPSFVVGVGASAGGLEAFVELLQNLPVDTGMAFVLIQHLDPNHESILPEILARATQMPVSQVKQNSPVESNHVYVIPANEIMTIGNGVLQLKRGKEAGPHRCIDIFLQSLAHDLQARAIGVVLSGAASDGTLGLEAVKAEGGITFAQDEQSAKYNSMPRSAAGSGAADFVLAPAKIAHELALLARRGPVSAHELDPVARPEPDANYRKILQLLRNRSGLDLSLYKPNTIQRRIARRMVLTRVAHMLAYVAYLRNHPEEIEALYQDILINVTGFFRDPETFDLVKTRVFPKLIAARSPDDLVRVWVIGCSTGQEAYSVAMSYTEFAAHASTQIPLQVFATDVNEAVLEKGRAGLYSKAQVQDLSPERLRRFFVEEAGGYRICKSIREMCVFAKHDIGSDPPFCRMDVLSCRNLLIYLHPTLQKKLTPVLAYALKPGGFLLLGASETLVDAADYLLLEDKIRKLYSRKTNPLQPPRVSAAAPPSTKTQGQARAAGPPGLELDAQKEADRVSLARFAPPGVLVSPGMEILQFRGKTGLYLEPVPGKASYNLLKMLREGLLVPVRTALEKARKEREIVRVENVRFQFEEENRGVNLEVVPLNNLKEPCFLICFEPVPNNPTAKKPAALPPAKRVSGQGEVTEENSRLRHELALLKEYLQSVTEEHEAANEELQAANEEAQSANEELRSINEELQTTKEELESTNEELVTVNEEMNSRNIELNRINSDLNNVLSGVQMCIVVLAGDLSIRRFTPLARSLLNLVPTDVGRPILNIKPNLAFPEFEKVILQTMDTVRPHEQEVQDKEGRWFSLRVLPYKTVDHRIDGALLILVDIDNLKRSEQHLQSARDRAEGTVEAVREPLLILTPELRVERANRSFYHTFRVSPAETVGRSLQELGKGQWDIPRLSAALKGVIAENRAFDDFEVEQDFERLGHRVMLLNARAIGGESAQDGRILLAIEDVTERRQLEVLRESEQRFRTLAEALPQLVWTCSPEGECDYFNSKWTQFTGVPQEELLGMQWREVLHPVDRERTCNYWLEALKGDAPYDLEYRIRRAEGEYHWFKVRATPLRDQQGNIIKWFGTCTDIDELQQSHEALERKVAERTAKLREMIGELESFSYTISHDLRAPLRAMVGFATLAIEEAGEQLNSTAKEYLQRIVTAANRLDRLIQDVLAYSRVLRADIKLAPIDLEGLVQDVIQQYPGFRSPQVEIEIKSPLLPVLAHGASLTQAVANIVSNAAKFVRPGTVPHIKIWTEEVGDQVRIWFEDNGIGISATDRERIFNMFERVHSPHEFDGTGIGLTIVRKAVERMDGRLGVESEPDRGSRFWIELKGTGADGKDNPPS